MRYLLIVLALVGCQLPEPHPVPFPGPLEGGVLPLYNADAETIPQVPERAQCGRMCDHMHVLGCPLGEPTPQRKEPCVSWCTRVQSKHEIDLHLDCLTAVSGCDHVKDCN